MLGVGVARKKKTGNHAKIRMGLAVTLKGSPEWKDWLERFADHTRLDVSKLIDKALVHYAASEGFEEPPRR